MATEIFGEGFKIDNGEKGLFMREKAGKPNFLYFSPVENSFSLRSRKYFIKTLKLAKEYEKKFDDEEAVILTDYEAPKN